MDLREGTYRVLDAIASDFWDIMVADGQDAQLGDLARRYDVNPDRVVHDFRAFVRTCRDHGLIVPLDRVTPPQTAAHTCVRAGWAPPVLLALHSMISTAWSLSRHGFPATYQACSEHPRGREATDTAGHVRHFMRAENFFLASSGANDCLVRSLSLFRFLNARGVCASHVIGVRRFPFVAHAWVEVDGRPVQQNVQDYAPLARI